jgi:hypothetical protein
MRSGRRLILRVAVAKASEPARRGHALFKGYETAIRAATGPSSAVNRAPRIVLGLSACSKANDIDANSEHEQQEPHGSLPLLGFSLGINACHFYLFQARAMRRGGHRGEAAGVAIEDTQRIASMKRCGLFQFIFQELNINPSVARTTRRQLAVDHDCGNGSDA